jgi:phosphomannomutase
LLKKERKNLSDLFGNLKCAAETKEIRIPVDRKDFDISQTKILNSLRNGYKKIPKCELEKDNSEGVRLNFLSVEENGWCLLRKSVHDSTLVLTIQSDIEGGSEKIFKSVWRIIKN